MDWILVNYKYILVIKMLVTIRCDVKQLFWERLISRVIDSFWASVNASHFSGRGFKPTSS